MATKPAVWLHGWEWDAVIAVWSITVLFVSYQFWPEFELQVGLRESRLLPSSNHSRRMCFKSYKAFPNNLLQMCLTAKETHKTWFVTSYSKHLPPTIRGLRFL